MLFSIPFLIFVMKNIFWIMLLPANMFESRLVTDDVLLFLANKQTNKLRALYHSRGSTERETEDWTLRLTLIMLLLRGISFLASNPTEVLAAVSPLAWLPGVTMDPEPTILFPACIPQSPFNTDTSQCVLPSASPPGSAVLSPTFNGGWLLSSPNSAI